MASIGIDWGHEQSGRDQPVAAKGQCRKGHGSTALYLFGFTARDDAGQASDLDLFIDYDPTTRFNAFDLVAIKLLLEEELRVPVDVTTRDGLHPRLRPSIEQWAVRIFLMAREFRHALDDMLGAINGIQAAVAGKTLADYQGDWVLTHAIQRGIEIISEASRALPDDVKALEAGRFHGRRCARSGMYCGMSTMA